MSPSVPSDLLEVPTSEELEQIQHVIRSDFSLGIHDFRIRAVDDGLILDGRTKTYYGKQMVQHAVMDLTDFSILANNIVVG